MRYKLRTLLLLTTLLAILCGSVVNRADQQRRTVELVQRLGGMLYFDYQYTGSDVSVTKTKQAISYSSNRIGTEPISVMASQGTMGVGGTIADSRVKKSSWPRWLRRLFRAESFRAVSFVSITATDLSEADLMAIGRLKSLKALHLARTNVTDEGLKHLRGLTRLKVLDLGDTAITNDGLRHLARLKDLQWLDVQDCKVTDEGMHHLAQLKDLKVLRIGRFRTPGAIRAAPSKEHRLTEAGVMMLTSLERLQILETRGVDVSDETRDDLRRLMPKVTIMGN